MIPRQRFFASLLGLSLARRIVAAHGGTIAVAQREPGALFEIVV